MQIQKEQPQGTERQKCEKEDIRTEYQQTKVEIIKKGGRIAKYAFIIYKLLRKLLDAFT